MTTVPYAQPLLSTDLPDVELIHRGKVRDVYRVGDDLLLVATDRVSAFDVVLPGGIPAKGTVLTQLSCFWFDRLQHVVSNHLISADVADFPERLRPFADQLAGRSMYARRAERFDVECVVRGYLIGSGWRDYQRSGEVCGIELPADLQQAARLPEPIFTPSTKADSGHDENVSVAQMAEMIGPEWTERLAEVSLRLYTEAAEYAGFVAVASETMSTLNDPGVAVFAAVAPSRPVFAESASTVAERAVKVPAVASALALLCRILSDELTCCSALWRT